MPFFLFMPLQDHHEAVLQGRLVNFLGKWFDITIEAKSDCGKGRIDILMFHTTDKERLFPIGIEIKPHDMKKGTEIGAWCRQAHRYTTYTFEGQHATIFTAPQISGFYLEEGKLVNKHDVTKSGDAGRHHNVNPFLYRSFGIGEFQKYTQTRYIKGDHYRMVINCKEVWCSEQGYMFHYGVIERL